MDCEFSDGYVEKSSVGYVGRLVIEGVDISPLDATYFKKDGEQCLFLRRKNMLEYDSSTGRYVERMRRPRWECLMKKKKGAIAYEGDFVFCKFMFRLTAIYDKRLASRDRLNLFVTRRKREEQTIINKIVDNGKSKR